MGGLGIEVGSSFAKELAFALRLTRRKGISQGKAVAKGGMGERIFFKKKSMSQDREKGMGVCRELKGHCGWKLEN